MLLHAVLFFSFLAAATTLVAMLPGLIRTRIWVGLPVGLVLIGATGTVGSFAGGDIALDDWLSGGALLAVIVVRLWMPRWSWLGAQLFATATLAAFSYLLYAGTLTFAGRHGYIYFACSMLLLLLELAALSLSVSYLFEIVDSLSRRPDPPPRLDATYLPGTWMPTLRRATSVFRTPPQQARCRRSTTPTSSSRWSTTTRPKRQPGARSNRSAKSSVPASSSCTSRTGRASRPAR